MKTNWHNQFCPTDLRISFGSNTAVAIGHLTGKYKLLK
jgi:hypothetical protein